MPVRVVDGGGGHLPRPFMNAAEKNRRVEVTCVSQLVRYALSLRVTLIEIVNQEMRRTCRMVPARVVDGGGLHLVVHAEAARPRDAL